MKKISFLIGSLGGGGAENIDIPSPTKSHNLALDFSIVFLILLF